MPLYQEIGSMMWLGLLTAGLITLISVKEIRNERKYYLVSQTDTQKSSNVWNAKDKDHVRSASFIWRSFYHHAFSKGRRLLHGAGGTMFLISGFIETGWFFVTRGNRAPDAIRTATLLSGIFMGLGFLTPYMHRKVSKLGFKKYVFYRFLSLSLGLMFSANSFYARPSLINENHYSISIISSATQRKIEDTCTILGFILPILSLLCAVYELRNRFIWTTKILVSNVLSAFPTIYAPLIYRLLFGKEAVEQLYQETNTGQAIYVLNLLGGVLTSLNTTLVILSLRKALYFSQRKRIASLAWTLYGVLCTSMISFCCPYQFVFVYILYFGILAFVQKCIPKWCFDNWLDNRKDLPNIDDGHRKGISYF